jgi:hypothetical protein
MTTEITSPGGRVRKVFAPTNTGAPDPTREGLGKPFTNVRAKGKLTVAGITPVAPGASMEWLRRVGFSFFKNESCTEWHIACAPEDVEEVTRIARESAPHFDILVTRSKNVANTRNRLIEGALTDYIVQVDADDVWIPGAIDKLVEIAGQPQYRDFTAIYGVSEDFWTEDESLDFKPPRWWAEFPDNVAKPGDYAIRRQEIARSGHERIGFGLAYYPTLPHSGIIRRDRVLEVGGYDILQGNFMEDSTMIGRLQARGSFYVDPDLVVFLYRNSGDGTLSGFTPSMEESWELDRRMKAAEQA